MEESFSTRKLLSGAELKELNTKSDLAGALQLGSHVGAILVLGYLHYLAMGSWWVIATGFCLGVTVNFLYAAQHELSHWTVFRTRYLNELFGRTVGFLMMFPRDYDMAMHQAHHRWTAHWERDGELTRAPYTLKSYLLYFWGFTYWYNRVDGLVRRALASSSSPISTRRWRRRSSVNPAFISLAIWSSPRPRSISRAGPP